MIATGQRLRLLIRYLRYRVKARDEYDIHSPFLYDFYTKVIRNRTLFPNYEIAEKSRKRMLSDKRMIEVTDLGTGGRELKGRLRRVNGIVKKYACSRKEGRLLFRIVQWLKPASMIELGTSAGIGSLYLKSGHPEGKLITVEGCPNTAALASENFNAAGVVINSVCGDFDNMLDEVIRACGGNVSFVYFDGNHTCEATLSYFIKCRDAATENAIFVFGDIHWSEGMEAAWNKIKKDPRSCISVDLFHAGIIFFNPALTKQDFILRY